MTKAYICEKIGTDNYRTKVEEIFNDIAEQGYRFVGSIPADVGSSGKVYSTYAIFEHISHSRKFNKTEENL